MELQNFWLIRTGNFQKGSFAKFSVVIEQGEDGYLVSDVVELPCCHTQAKTMDELITRTREAISLYLRCKKPSEVAVKFLGLQQIEIEA